MTVVTLAAKYQKAAVLLLVVSSTRQRSMNWLVCLFVPIILGSLTSPVNETEPTLTRS